MLTLPITHDHFRINMKRRQRRISFMFFWRSCYRLGVRNHKLAFVLKLLSETTNFCIKIITLIAFDIEWQVPAKLLLTWFSQRGWGGGVFGVGESNIAFVLKLLLDTTNFCIEIITLIACDTKWQVPVKLLVIRFSQRGGKTLKIQQA